MLKMFCTLCLVQILYSLHTRPKSRNLTVSNKNLMGRPKIGNFLSDQALMHLSYLGRIFKNSWFLGNSTA